MRAMPALVEARESLNYWETRLQTLPQTAVRKRREAREMAARCRERVVEAERAEYGAGLARRGVHGDGGAAAPVAHHAADRARGQGRGDRRRDRGGVDGAYSPRGLVFAVLLAVIF